MPITSDVVIAGSVRWLSSTYPRQVSSLERLLFGTQGFTGLVHPDAIDALASRVPTDTASDNVCESLVADAVVQSLNGILARRLEPAAHADSVAALSAAIVNPVLEPNLVGQGRPIQIATPPSHPKPAEGSPIKDETIEAIKEGAQNAIDAAFPEKVAIAMKFLLFGGFGIPGLVDDGQIAVAALQGNVVTPEDVTDLMAMSLISTCIEIVLKKIFEKIGVEAAEDVAGTAGSIAIAVFRTTSTAGPGLDQMHPAGSLPPSSQQGSNPDHPGAGHDNAGHPTAAGPGGNSGPSSNPNAGGSPAVHETPAPSNNGPGSNQATTPTHDPPPVNHSGPLTDTQHGNSGGGAGNRGGGGGGLAGGGEGPDHGGGGLAKTAR